MSLISENIIPGNYGKLFGTNAVEEEDLLYIKEHLVAIEGVNNVVINNEIFPREFTVYTTQVVTVGKIEEVVKLTGFNAIPK